MYSTVQQNSAATAFAVRHSFRSEGRPAAIHAMKTNHNPHPPPIKPTHCLSAAGSTSWEPWAARPPYQRLQGRLAWPASALTTTKCFLAACSTAAGCWLLQEWPTNPSRSPLRAWQPSLHLGAKQKAMTQAMLMAAAPQHALTIGSYRAWMAKSQCPKGQRAPYQLFGNALPPAVLWPFQHYAAQLQRASCARWSTSIGDYRGLPVIAICHK